MSSDKNDLIEIKCVRARSWQRYPCTVCGGCTEKVDVHAESDALPPKEGSVVAESSACGWDDVIRVCEPCLEAGDIDERLAQRAMEIEAGIERRAAESRQHVQFLRSLVGRLKVPTFAQWEEAGRALSLERFQMELASAYERGKPEKAEAIKEDYEELYGGQLPEAYERAFVAARGGKNV